MEKNRKKQREFIYHRCAVDKPFFVAYFFGSQLRNSFAPFHYEILQDDPDYVNNLYLIPRGHSKSTLITIYKTVYDICYKLKKYTAIFSATKPQAIQRLTDIRSIISNNQLLRWVYGVNKSKSDWNKTFIQTESGIYVQAGAVCSEARGLLIEGERPDRVVFDDLLKTKEALSPVLRQQTKDFANEVVEFIGSPDLSIDIAGTRSHPQDLYSEYERRADFKVHKYQALVEPPLRHDLWQQWRELIINLDDANHLSTAMNFYVTNKLEMDAGARCLWEDRHKPTYPNKLYEIQVVRATAGEGAFLKELQNEPIDPERIVLDMDRAEWFDIQRVSNVATIIRDNGTSIPVSQLVTYVIIDPAGTPKTKNAKSDFTAIVVIGRDNAGRLYVLDDFIKRVDSNTFLNRAYELASPDQWRAVGIRIKSTGTQNTYYTICNRIRDDRQKRNEWADAVITPVNETTNKIERIGTIKHFIDNRWLLFRRGLSQEFINQVKQFPNGDHDDAPDALEDGVNYLKTSYAA